MKRYVKDKNAKKDYEIDWSAFLGSDTLTASTVTPDAPLWSALTAYRADTLVRLSGGAFLEVTVAGTSGALEPTQPSLGATVVDGSITWLRSFSIESNTNTNTAVTLWVAGGTTGREYGAINHVTSAGLRTEDETLVFAIIDK